MMTGECSACRGRCHHEHTRCWHCYLMSVRGSARSNELTVLQKLADTGSIKQAADVLKISDKTAEFHLSKMREKVKPGMSLYSLIAWGFRTGQIVALMFFLGCASRPADTGFVRPKPPALPKVSAANKPVSISTNLTFAWFDTNNPKGSISFYKLWQGPTSGNYTNHFDSTTTNATITVTSGNYFFNVTAVATNNNESKPNGEVGYSVPFTQTKPGKPHR